MEPSCTEEGKIFAAGKKIVYPPDRAEIGRAAWKYVHARAAAFEPEKRDVEEIWLKSFIALYPCRHCARDFLEICNQNPPVLTNRPEYEKWWRDAHNAVNRDLGKPQF